MCAGQVTVRITITDVNDNPPVFTKSSYKFTAPEDLGTGVNVDGAKVLALDPDSGNKHALLTLYLTCQFWALAIQQQIKI